MATNLFFSRDTKVYVEVTNFFLKFLCSMGLVLDRLITRNNRGDAESSAGVSKKGTSII